jgi:hypothetical protein
LFVKLLFDYLELRIRDGVPRVSRGWVNVFKTLSATVKEAYVGFLNRVRKCHRDDVRRLFQIVVAAERPLTLREVNIALNIWDCSNGSKYGLGLQDENGFRGWILSACMYFLDVYNGRVYFIHQTAKDFLLEEQDQNGLGKPDWLGDFTMQTCHRTLAESCVLYLSLPLRTPSAFMGAATTQQAADEYHLWGIGELGFASYAHFNWHSHARRGMLNTGQFGNQLSFDDFMETWRPWPQEMSTCVRLGLPWSATHRAALDKALAPEDGRVPWGIGRFGVGSPHGQVLTIAANNSNLQIVDAHGLPLLRVPCIPINDKDVVKKLNTVLRSLATFQTVRSLINYQFYSPLPADWFSVRMFNKAKPSATTSGKLELSHGDVLS